MLKFYLYILLAGSLLSGCSQRAPMPPAIGTTKPRADGLARFEKVASYQKGGDDFRQIRRQIREGDVIAFWMPRRVVRKNLFHSEIGSLAFLAFKYGHLAITVKVPGRDPELRLFSCLPRIGSHYSGGLDELQDKNFVIFRLDQWERMNSMRLREFANAAREKSDHGFVYNYLAASGLWSKQLEPRTPREIKGAYSCSTSVAAALHYAGLDLTKVRNRHVLEIISPRKVFTSTGRIIDTQQPVIPSKKPAR